MKANWKRVLLSEIFSISRGGSPRPIDEFITDDEDGVNWVMISDATDGGKLISGTKKKIRKEGASRSRMVYPGDFLLTNSMSFGKPYIMNTQGCIHDGWLVLSPRISDFSPDYFYYLLGSNRVYSEFAKRAAGATVKNLNIDLVKGVEVELPPLPEQRRIAAILDKAEALRTKRRAALTKLDGLAQSIFQEMFGDPILNENEWDTDVLQNLTRKIGSGSTPSGGDESYKDTGISLIRSMNVHDGEFVSKGLAYIDESQAAKLSGVIVECDDVLLNITGASVTRVCRAPNVVLPARVNQHVCIIRPKARVLPCFMEKLLLHWHTKQVLLNLAGAGATREAITKAQLEGLVIIVPPLPLQQAFARRIEAIESLKERHRASLAKLDALFASLQHRAFRGEL